MAEEKDLSYEIYVRYNECDPSGYAFNANFFIWVQDASSKYWNDIGLDIKAMAATRQIFMAVHLECDFMRPVAFGDIIHVRPKVTQVKNSSVEFQYQVHNGAELSAVAKSIHVFMDTKEKKKLALTDELRAKLENCM
jgi:acyl-CoA thioester hydrolase